MQTTADAVVIGGGIMGASTAYHLAKRGCSNVAVIEMQELFGMGSTGQNAGGFRHQFATAVNIELSTLSVAMMERFPSETGQALGMRRCGYLFLLDNEADLTQFRDNVVLQNSLGVPSRLLGLDEIGALAPELELTGIIGGTWCALDGLVDPGGLLQGYVASASRLGATMHTHAAVTALSVAGGRMRSVVTTKGTIETPIVVITAGAWSASIGAMAGVEIPIQPIRRQIAVTGAIAGLRGEFPFVIDFGRALYFHREGAGILTGMSNRDERPSFTPSVDPEWRLHHFTNAVARLPLLGEAGIATEWAGLYEVTPDHQPLIGRLPHVEGLFICAGFSGHGLMHAPAAGLLIAEEVLDGGAKSIDIGDLAPTRFETGFPRGEYNVV